MSTRRNKIVLIINSISNDDNAKNYAPYVAPDGYYWDFVTDFGSRVTEEGYPIVDLVRR